MGDESSEVSKGESLGDIESPKAVSNIYAPVDLEIGKFK